VSAAVKGKKGKKTPPKKKAAADKPVPKKPVPKKPAPKKAVSRKPGLRKPRQVENLMAGEEVRRKFTMTVQVSGREFLADPVAATRRVLILALTQIPPKIHEQQIDNESTYKGMFSKGAETRFKGVLNDPKNLTPGGAFHSPNVWEWRPSDR
jgi:hypothetical protein